MDLQFGHPIFCPMCPKWGTTKFRCWSFSYQNGFRQLKKTAQLFFELVYPDLRHVVIVSHRIIGTVTHFWGEPVTILLWWHFKNVMCPVTWILVWSVHKLSTAQCQGRLSLEISRRCCPISQDAWLGHIWMSTPILYLCTCLFRCTRPIY